MTGKACLGDISAYLKRSLVLLVFLLPGCGEKASEKDVQTQAPAQGAAQDQQAAWPIPADADAAAYLKQCQADYDQINSQLAELITPERSYATPALLTSINAIDMLLDKQMNLASLYANVHPNAAIRENAEFCEQKFVALISDLSLSRPLYDRLVAVDPEPLDTLDRRYVEHMLKDFKRSGVDKDETTRDRIKKLTEEINLIGQTFDKNIREGTRQLVLDSVDDLAGLPQDYIDNHKPNEQGKIVLTTVYPDYYPFMQYARNDELRKQFYIIFRQQAYPQNKEVLHQLISKRHELAQLLGYKNFSEFVTEDKMIQSPQNAQTFIDRVSAIATPRAQAEYQQLLARKQKNDPKATKVEDWQKIYIEDLVKKEQYQVDAQLVRQYFHFKNVRQGIFDLTETMFGITIKPWKAEVWHESVNAYEVWDGDKVIGRFYLDMHPRDGKYKHAAEFSIVNGITGVQLPVAALVCNFPGGDGSSGLMEHSDVETFLHEFGHLMHNLFAGTNQRWMYFSGIKTEWDFVEAPSQMLEEWVWDAETLATFARNDKGEVIPPALVEKMIAARDFGRGMWTKHQLFYAALSLGVYNQNPTDLELDKVMDDIQSKYSPFGYVDDTYFYASFGHLNGYSSIYYTYMWSLVIAADMHSEFVKKGLRNPELAHHYRKTVLEPGGTKDAADLVKDFLGRPYSFDAFAQDLSIDPVK
jgi:thimet oligopeptidase